MLNKHALDRLFRDVEKTLSWTQENRNLILRKKSKTVVLMKLDQTGEKLLNRNKYNLSVASGEAKLPSVQFTIC